MTSGWGMVTAGVLVRSAVAMTLAPPKLLRTTHASMAWRASVSGARLYSGGDPPIRPGVMAHAGQRAGDGLPSASPAEGGLRLPPRLAPPPPDFVRHAYSPRAGPLWNSVAAFLGWNEERARELVEFGGVYYKPTSAPATAKPKRELDPERQVEIGEYLRIFPEPRRYPSFFGVDWESKIVYESPGVMLVNKPPGVPAHATVDNFGENMLAGIREVRPELELFLPHRLDVDTSGLVIVAKSQETLRSINDVIKRPGLSLQTDGESPRARKARNKALRRAAAAAATLPDRRADTDTDTAGEEDAGARVAASAEEAGASEAADAHGGAGLAPAGTITKRYRALVQVLPGSSPLKASPDPLTHFLRISNRAPKDFRRDRPKPRQPVGNGSGQAGKEPQEGEGESWIECRLKVASATDAFLPTRAGETSLGGGVLAGVTGGGSGSGHQSRLQEVEVELLTGRTHQIRGQLAVEGCPIYGDLLYGPPPKRRTESSPSHAAGAATSVAAAATAAVAAERSGDTVGSFVLRRGSPPPPPPSPALGVDDDVDSEGGGAAVGVGGASESEHAGFVESPKMALQACHISLEFDGESGERERHSFTLGRGSCWWVEEEPWVAAGVPC